MQIPITSVKALTSTAIEAQFWVVFFFWFFVGCFRVFFSDYEGEGWEQNFTTAPYAPRSVKRICMEVLQHHPDRDLVPEVVFNFQAPPSKKRQKKNTQYLQCLATKAFDILGRETQTFFWLQNSENHLNRSYLTGTFLSTTFMKTFGVNLESLQRVSFSSAFTTSPP